LWIAQRFYLQQKGFYCEFLRRALLAGSLRVQVNVQVCGSDASNDPGFFKRFLRGDLAMREARLNATFGESPLPRACSHQ
jgi:hypothetical protein